MEPLVRVGERARPIPRPAVAGEIREASAVITWQAGKASPLDIGEIAKGSDVGTIRVRDGQWRDVARDVMSSFAFNVFFSREARYLGGDLNVKCVDTSLH